MKFKKILLIIIVLVIAFLLRTFGLNWDQSQHLHPDERFMTMVASDINLPKNLSDYFNTKKSSFNPANHNYGFYAYGTFPLLLTKTIALLLSLNSYGQIFLVGRVLSAVFDTGIILVLYFLCKLLKLNQKTSLIVCFFYCLTVFPIQLSHFFTVDTFTVFFSTLSIFLFLKYLKDFNKIFLIFSGIVFGISLSCKISLIITLPLFLLFLFFKSAKLKRIGLPLLFLLSIFLSFRIFQPYAFNGLFQVSPDFVKNITLANKMVTGDYQYPPNIQWYSTIVLLHPFLNIFFFGLGPLLTLFAVYGIKKNTKYHFILLFISIIFIYQGIQLAKYMRYFYPIYPFLILFAGIGFDSFFKKIFLKKFILLIILFGTFIFLNIYYYPHSRIKASDWICQNLPLNSKISFEYWDDPLPINSDKCHSSNKYNLIQLDISSADTSPKWQAINNDLDRLDYIILSSNRFWASISKNSKNFPNTSKFYQDLFADKLNFKKVKTFYSYPGLSIPFLKKCFLIGPSAYPANNSFFEIDGSCAYPGIYIRDNWAEESFTVYDHPQVIIFKKDKKL